LSRRGVVAALAAAGLLLSGCASSPGAAAVVDGHAVSEQSVLSRTQNFVTENLADNPDQANNPTVLALLNRYQATDVVRHQLVLAAAKAEGISVTNQQVNEFVQQNGGAQDIAKQLTVPADAVDEAIYDYLVLGELIDRIPADGASVTDITVTVDVVPEKSRDDAVAARAKYLADPRSMGPDATAARAADPQLPGGEVSLLQNPEAALVGIFSAPQGEIVLVPQGTDTYYLVRVTKRTEKPAKLTKDAAQSTSSLDGHLVLASLLLARYPQARDVTVNPRFGDWDPQTLQVVAGNSGL
jgi:hypothetical protein